MHGAEVLIGEILAEERVNGRVGLLVGVVGGGGEGTARIGSVFLKRGEKAVREMRIGVFSGLFVGNGEDVVHRRGICYRVIGIRY